MYKSRNRKTTTSWKQQAVKGVRGLAARAIQRFWRNRKGIVTGVKQGLKKRKFKLAQKATLQGTGGSFSKFFYGRRKLPLPKNIVKNLGIKYFVTNNASRFTGGIGQQQFSQPVVMFSPTALTTMQSILPGGSGAGGASQKFMVMKCSSELSISNCTLGNTRLILYDIVARRDLQSGVLSPLAAITSGFLDVFDGASSDYTTLGYTPFQNPRFTEFFKIVKMTHVILSQGQVHIHRISYHPNKIISGELDARISGGIRGLTCYTMIQQWGDPDNDGTVKTTVSTSSTAIDVVAKYQYQFTALQESTKGVKFTNALPATYTGTESLIDIGSGLVTAMATS